MNTNPGPSNGLSPSCVQYSLPTPKGGKYAINPHLTEDQRFPQLRLSRKARQKTDVFAPDYVAGVSPFAENDISSRSATLQVRDSWGVPDTGSVSWSCTGGYCPRFFCSV